MTLFFKFSVLVLDTDVMVVTIKLELVYTSKEILTNESNIFIRIIRYNSGN